MDSCYFTHSSGFSTILERKRARWGRVHNFADDSPFFLLFLQPVARAQASSFLSSSDHARIHQPRINTNLGMQGRKEKQEPINRQPKHSPLMLAHSPLEPKNFNVGDSTAISKRSRSHRSPHSSHGKRKPPDYQRANKQERKDIHRQANENSPPRYSDTTRRYSSAMNDVWSFLLPHKLKHDSRP